MRGSNASISRRRSDLRPALSVPFDGERSMLDVILIAVGCGCFAVAIAYAYACDRL
jgi:hypothetical protein